MVALGVECGRSACPEALSDPRCCGTQGVEDEAFAVARAESYLQVPAFLGWHDEGDELLIGEDQVSFLGGGARRRLD